MRRLRFNVKAARGKHKYFLFFHDIANIENLSSSVGIYSKFSNTDLNSVNIFQVTNNLSKLCITQVSYKAL